MQIMILKKISFLIQATILSIFCFQLPAFSDEAGQVVKERKADSQVASRIHLVNEMEIKMGKMAREKGTTADVTNFGERLMKDHAAADKELMKVVSDMNLKLTSRPVASSAAEIGFNRDTKELMRKLQASTGDNFNQAFLKGMMSGHQQFISQMKVTAHELPDSQLKTYISDTLIPNLHEHYDIAMTLENRMFAQSAQNQPSS